MAGMPKNPLGDAYDSAIDMVSSAMTAVAPRVNGLVNSLTPGFVSPEDRLVKDAAMKAKVMAKPILDYTPNTKAMPVSMPTAPLTAPAAEYMPADVKDQFTPLGRMKTL
jgi:hypothetical protein